MAFIGLDVCYVLNQPITDYVSLDLESSDMIQSCLNDENVVPDNLLDNYDFVNMDFSSTTIDIPSEVNASDILYASLDTIPTFTNPNSFENQLKSVKNMKIFIRQNETRFLNSLKISSKNVEDLQQLTKDLVSFGKNMTIDFRCTPLNSKYSSMKNSICYMTSTFGIYSMIFLLVNLLGIPLLSYG